MTSASVSELSKSFRPCSGKGTFNLRYYGFAYKRFKILRRVPKLGLTYFAFAV